MRLPLDAVGTPTPDTTAAENGRLVSVRGELARLRHEFDAYKARANEYDELRSLRSDLRQFIEKVMFCGIMSSLALFNRRSSSPCSRIMRKRKRRSMKDCVLQRYRGASSHLVILI